MFTRTRTTFVLTAALLSAAITCTTPAWAQQDAKEVPLPGTTQARPVDLANRAGMFLAANPTVSVGTWQGHDSVYGPAFSFGVTARDSVEGFRKEMLPMFGIEPADLVPGIRHLEGDNTLQLMPDGQGGYKFTAIYYTQQRDGIEVFGTAMVGLVRNDPGAGYPLVLVKTALRDIGGFRASPQALGSVNPNAAYQKALTNLVASGGVANRTQFSPARTVIYAGVNTDIAGVRLSVEFIGMTDNPRTGWPIHRRFVSDASAGTILYSEELINDVDVTGNVSGMTTPGYGAMACSPPAVLMPMPYARVGIGATFAFADVNGNFTIPNAGAGSVQVDSLVRGRYFIVNNTGGNAAMSLNVTPPGPANFVYPATTELLTAQTNVYIHANVVRDFVLANHPTYPVIAGEINFAANTAVAGTCNAFYSSANQSINFYNTGGGCNSTAFSNVVHHEYGHRVINAAGSGQGQYGEGMSDTLGNLISDASCTGSGFQTCGVCLREANNNHQFPQNGPIHDAGRLISGCVWSTRNLLLAAYPGTYRQILNPLIVNSIPLHVPTSNTTITPQITIDVLTLDDDDANLANGTPHYEQINGGFAAHNMAGPPVTAAIIVSPTAGPTHQGIVGGPYTNDPFNYTMENNTAVPANYTVEVVAGGTAPLLLNGSSGPVNGTLAGAQLINFPVSVNPSANSLAAGIYSSTVRFSDTTNNVVYNRIHVLEIGQVGFSTTPANGLISGGPVGGPFNATQIYTMTSTKPTAVTVRVAAGAPWISLDGGAGPVDVVLNGIGATANVTVGFSAAATSLPAGLVNSSVTFTNIGSGGSASDTSRAISLDVGRFTYAATDLPIPICDLCQNIISNITVPDAYCVGDVDVQVDITHTYQGDLIVEVINPQGVVVRLHNRTGGGADNIHKLYSDEGPNVPDGPGLLSAFDGVAVGGLWRLRVSDNAGIDIGTIDAWQLKIAAAGNICPPIANNVSVTVPVVVSTNITLNGVGTQGALTYIITSLPANGSLADPNGGAIGSVPYSLLSLGNQVTYTPAGNYSGSDTFAYKVNDGQDSGVANVNITVQPPVAINQNVTVPVIVTSNITLTGTPSAGGPSTSYVIASQPANGTLLDPNGGLIGSVPYTLLGGGNVVRYKPSPVFAGADNFSFRLMQRGVDSNLGIISIIVGGPQNIHVVNMNTNPGWSGTVAGEWGFGQPTGGGVAGQFDPTSGYTGTNVYGYNLAGHYPNNLNPIRWLTSTAFDMTGVTQCELRFRRWLGMESATFDHAYIDYSTNGTTWTNIYNHTGGTFSEQTWTLQTYSIPLADNQPTVYLRWGMGTTDGSVTRQGWNIDDVEMRGIRPPCLYDIANGDRLINIDDLVLVITSWGVGGGYGPADIDPPGGNGTVDIDDLVKIITNWGACP